MRCRIGDTVRFYGFPGTFKIVDTAKHGYDWYAVREGSPKYTGFPMHDGSVVEINGTACPMLSLPIAPPADDYPYTVTMVCPPESERALPLCDCVRSDPRFDVIDVDAEAAKVANAVATLGVMFAGMNHS